MGIQMWTRQTEGEQIVEREIIQQRGRKNKELGLYAWVHGIKKREREIISFPGEKKVMAVLPLEFI